MTGVDVPPLRQMWKGWGPWTASLLSRFLFDNFIYPSTAPMNSKAAIFTVVVKDQSSMRKSARDGTIDDDITRRSAQDMQTISIHTPSDVRATSEEDCLK